MPHITDEASHPTPTQNSGKENEVGWRRVNKSRPAKDNKDNRARKDKASPSL